MPTGSHLSGNPQSAIRNGFTLIELMVVLIGLVIVAAVVVPSVRGTGQRGDLEGAASKVAASARFAREVAVERQETVGLTIEPETMRVRLVVEEEIQGSAMPATRREEQGAQVPLPARYAAVRLPPGLIAHLEPAPEEPQGTSSTSAASLADGVLRFTPDGRTTGGVVVLTDIRGRERRVVVTPETGVVRVEDGDV